MTAHEIQTAATPQKKEAGQEPAHGAEIVVSLNRLKASPRNARKVRHPEAAIEALAASIRARGVLQAPVVEIERDREGVATGSYLVTIGEGRRQALRLLVKRKAIKRTHPVRVVVDTLNDAHEISLDENITREAMHPADQFEAFRRLAEEKGYGPEEIAARFGVSAQVVRQRLRLAAAAPELMSAYRDGTITLDLLTAFCVSEDQDRQRQVLAQMGPYPSVFAIRRAMTEARVRADERRAVFVGLEAYQAAGGEVVRDLFTEDGGGWLQDPVLLDRLVTDKLEALAGEVRQREGWKWAGACAEFAEVPALGRVYPVPVERSEADAAEIAALSAEYDRLISETDAEEVFPPEVDARLEAIDRALQAHGPDYDYTPEARARAGVMVMLGHDGLARFERGLVRAEDAARTPPPWEDDGTTDGDDPGYATAGDAASDETGGEGDAAGTGDAPAPLSDRLLVDLTARKTMGLRDAVQADVGTALATVVHAMALQVFYPGYGDFSPLQLRLSVGELERLAPGVADSPAGRRVTDRLEAWGVRLPERAESLWAVVSELCRSDLLDLLACCAGVGLHAVREPHDRRPAARAQAETLATAVGLDMTGTWTATAASYFSRVPKARILEAVSEAVGPQEAGRIAGLRKGDMAGAAERLLEGSGWLPTVLRVAPPEGGAGAAGKEEEAGAAALAATAPDDAPAGSRVQAGHEAPAVVEDGQALAAE